LQKTYTLKDGSVIRALKPINLTKAWTSKRSLEGRRRTVQPFLQQYYDLPFNVASHITDLQALQDIYLNTNPLMTALAFATVFVTPIVLLVSEVEEEVVQQEEDVVGEAAQQRINLAVEVLAECKSSFRRHWEWRLSRATIMWELRQVSVSRFSGKR